MATIVTAHQPNFLPGMSVVSKIRAADVVVWLDNVQFTKGGFTNRNRLPNGDWLTVPIEKSSSSFQPISKVKVGSPKRDWRDRLCAKVREAWGDGDLVEQVCCEITRPYGLLLGLNMALLQITVPELAHRTRWAWQSMLDAGDAVIAVSEQRSELLPISDRLAMMVAELGGDVYLSGSSGRNYLNEEPFKQRGIEVTYWQHTGPNPCVLDVLSRVEVAA